MSEPFQPTQVDLIPLTTLLAGATITDNDLDAAIKDWEADPPDDQFKLLLAATVDNDTQT